MMVADFKDDFHTLGVLRDERPFQVFNFLVEDMACT